MSFAQRVISFFTAIWLLMAVAYWMSYKTDRYTLFPFSDTGYVVNTYHEGIDTNWSEATASVINNKLVLKYRLSTALEEPFAGLNITRKNASQFIDISAYNAASITLKAKRGKRIPFTFTLNYPRFTYDSVPLSNMPFTSILDCDTSFATYNINLSEFETPSWWYRHHKRTSSSFASPDFSRVNYIVVGSCQVLPKQTDDEIEVQSIVFMHNNTQTNYVFGSIFLASFVLFIIILVSRNKRKNILVPYKAYEVTTDGSNPLSNIVGYIAEKYSDPELSLTDLQRDLGISSKQISKLIKDSFEVSFTDYINTVRIAEVKRLLKETKLPISDIAYKVGYNNVSHFNRVFKSIEGVSPKQYRESE